MTTTASPKTPIAGMGDEPAHDLRALLDRADPTRASGMIGGHVGLEYEFMRIGLARPQPCDPFGGSP